VETVTPLSANSAASSGPLEVWDNDLTGMENFFRQMRTNSGLKSNKTAICGWDLRAFVNRSI
ncbi:MAG: hypothetical protein M3N26_00005, partial [Pseudomonadota bacterium]|nr:hypothetical protein [Pseudomonadota bacterium]